MIEKKHPEKAASLFMAILCLTVLSVLGLLFFKISILFQTSSSNKNAYLYARMIAEASMQYAITQIPNVAMDRAYSDPFKKHQIGTAFPLGYSDSVSIPIEKDKDFQYPSFKIGNHPKLQFAYSYKDKYDDLYDTYATLKIIDANALVNINAPLNVDIKNTSLEELRTTTFAKLLFNLLSHIPSFSNLNKTAILDSILQKRWYYEKWNYNTQEQKQEGQTYKRLTDLYHLVSENLMNKSQADILIKYVTLSNWINEKALVYGQTKFESRPPVNINLAPKPVLMAVMQNIIKTNLESLAEEIIQYREKTENKGFKSWNEVEKFFLKSSYLNQDTAYKLFASIYPGVLLNDHDPDRFHYRPYDKLDIKQEEGTTEFCLFSPGIFSIEAFGRTVNKYDQIVSKARLVCNVKLWETHVINTQEDFNNTATSLAAWRANFIELLDGSHNDYKSGKNKYFGYLFEGNPEFDQKSAQDQDKARIGCAFWFAKTDPKNRRVDGEFMERLNPARAGYPDMKVEPKGKYAINNSFDLWFKPNTKYDGEKIEIMRKCETGDNSTGTIITRCAYDPQLSTASGTKSGYVLTRTLVFTNSSQGGEIRTRARVLYGKKLQSRSTLRNNLETTGARLYEDIGYALRKDYEGTNTVVYVDSKVQNAFKAEFAQKVYGAYGGDEDETVSMFIKFRTLTINHSTGQITPGQIVVEVRGVTSGTWNTARVLSAQPSQNSFTTVKTFHQDIFGDNPTIETYDRTYAQPEETEDICEFPAMNYHNDQHTQSRSEMRIDSEAPKPGYWYRIKGSWTDKDIIVQDFCLYERKFDDPDKEEEATITPRQGTLYKEGIGGPIHIWRLKDARDYEQGHAHFICHGCTIYQSLNDDDWKNIRYKKTAFQGQLDCLSLFPEKKQENNGQKIEEGFRYLFGTVSWTGFEPFEKDKIIVNIDEKKFFRDGIPEEKPEYAPNPLFKKIFFKKLKAGLENTPIPFEIIFPGGENTFETSLFDQLLFHLLVDPYILQYTEVEEDDV